MGSKRERILVERGGGRGVSEGGGESESSRDLPCVLSYSLSWRFEVSVECLSEPNDP